MSTHDLTACALSQAYRNKQLSPVEATAAALARAQAWEPKLNAMYVIDADGALAQARASEARWRAGTPLSALDGVPITIKDNLAVAGFPAPLGTASGDTTPSRADAPPSARVREAGCVIIGKTTMPDYGMLVSGVSSLHGITRNPWNPARNPGGSSSGAGASLAARYTPLALGTDIAGSVRLPAAYNGVFALKPSLGRVPTYPPFLGRTTGPMTRTVADAALLLTALTRPDARDYMCLPYQDIDWPAAAGGDAVGWVRGRRIGLMLDIGAGLPCQPAVAAAVTAAARLFEAAGAVVTPVAPFLDGALMAGLDGFFQARLLADIERLPPERAARTLPFILAWCRRGASLRATDAANNLQALMTIREKAVAATAGCDFVLTPTSPITAYSAEEATPGDDPARPFEHVAFTAPFNMSEQPAASVCAGHDGDGLPIGLQIVGHRFDDAGVLRLAAAYEAMREAPRPWPGA